jgi:YfiH family protein
LKQVDKNGLRYYQDERWEHLPHGIFSRLGGKSHAPWSSLNVGGTVGDAHQIVRENHQLMYDALGVDGARACTTWQVHGADVVVANHPVEGRRWLERADGLITNRPDVVLVQRYADCVPLLFHDPVKHVIGLSHAGWRGTVQGMASNTVHAMQNIYDSQPEDIQVLIGPSISCDNYQVGEEVVEALQRRYGKSDALMRRDPADQTAYVNLWEANRLDLERVGVRDVKIMGVCTFDNTDEFFSHRGENGRAGRFGVVMSL